MTSSDREIVQQYCHLPRRWSIRLARRRLTIGYLRTYCGWWVRITDPTGENLPTCPVCKYRVGWINHSDEMH